MTKSRRVYTLPHLPAESLFNALRALFVSVPLDYGLVLFSGIAPQPDGTVSLHRRFTYDHERRDFVTRTDSFGMASKEYWMTLEDTLRRQRPDEVRIELGLFKNAVDAAHRLQARYLDLLSNHDYRVSKGIIDLAVRISDGRIYSDLGAVLTSYGPMGRVDLKVSDLADQEEIDAAMDWFNELMPRLSTRRERV